MEQYSVTEGDGLVEVCVQFVTLSDDTKDMDVPVTIATVPIQNSAVGKYTECINADWKISFVSLLLAIIIITMHAHKGIQLCGMLK